MLQVLDPASTPLEMRPIAVGELAGITAADGPLIWIDAEDPTPAERAAIADAFGWSSILREAVDAEGPRQRIVRAGGWGAVSLRAPIGGGSGDLVVGDAAVVTLRRGWPLDVPAALSELASWEGIDQAGPMAVVCTLLNDLVDAYDEQASEIEDRLVQQEGSLLETAAGGDPLPALREAADLRAQVGDLRRRANRLREVLGAVVRQELIDRRHGEAVDLELRDAYDHLLRVHDDLDAYGERLIALQDSRLSLVAYRQNDITKKISGWGAVLLIPTITTGWYGQNFQHLLWLDQPVGPWFSAGVALIAMTIAAILLRRANWL